MSTKTTIKSFINEFISVIKGDDVQAKSEKVFRQVSSALNTHISNMNGDTINFEDKISEAKENLTLVRYNKGEFVVNRDQYIRDLLSAKNALTEAEEALEKHQAKLDFLKSELKQHETDVPVND